MGNRAEKGMVVRDSFLSFCPPTRKVRLVAVKGGWEFPGSFLRFFFRSEIIGCYVRYLIMMIGRGECDKRTTIRIFLRLCCAKLFSITMEPLKNIILHECFFSKYSECINT